MADNLPLFTASKAPRVSDQDVAWMLSSLRGQGWMTARELLGLQVGRTERQLRAMAAASQGQIISGQRGYARTDQASVEDVNHAAAWLESQAKSMQARARAIRSAMHQTQRRSA